VETAPSRVLERNERRSALILAVLKTFGNRPELREVLIMVVRTGRMSPEMLPRREDGIGQGGRW